MFIVGKINKMFTCCINLMCKILEELVESGPIAYPKY